MRLQRSILLVTAWLSLALGTQGASQPTDPRMAEIQAKHRRGEKVTEEERDYVETKIERQNQEQSALRNADWAKEHPARESTGLVPLPDLGKGAYQGEPGGLYPGSENTVPPAHAEAGRKLCAKIVPLDSEGRPAAKGRVVLATIGMSNTTQESRSFLKLV